jgi:hypothetical protein
MRYERKLAEDVWYEVSTAVNVGETLFELPWTKNLFCRALRDEKGIFSFEMRGFKREGASLSFYIKPANSWECAAFSRECAAFSREYSAFSREYAAYSREYSAYSREYAAFSREYAAFSRECAAELWKYRACFWRCGARSTTLNPAFITLPVTLLTAITS